MPDDHAETVTHPVTSTATSFRTLGLGISTVSALADVGLISPFAIQAEAIPPALSGQDILGRAPTGSGKTFAFGLPMIERLSHRPSKPAHPRGLILAPTRELAAQIADRLSDIAARNGLRLLCIVGGVNIKRHITALAAPVDILVATPGRAEDLIRQKKLYLDHVEITALDEADHMADMGFIPQVTRLLDATDPDGQRLLFSATLDGEVDKLTKKYLRQPVHVSTAPVEAAVDTMDHCVIDVGTKQTRGDVVEQIAARSGSTIMFMRAKYAVDKQVKKLRRVGIAARGLHGDKSQNARVTALDEFTQGISPVLVATDIAARGIDVGGVDLVVHIDPPAEHKAYLHRAGRTARAGQSGIVVTLMMEEQRADVEKLMEKAKVKPRYLSLNEDEWKDLTGAQTPSGEPLDLPQKPKKRAPKKAQTAQTARNTRGSRVRRKKRSR